MNTDKNSNRLELDRNSTAAVESATDSQPAKPINGEKSSTAVPEEELKSQKVGIKSQSTAGAESRVLKREPQSAADISASGPAWLQFSITSPNFVFGLTLVFIAILWLVISVTPFSNVQVMAQILAGFSSGMIVAFVLAFFMTLLAGILNAKYSPRFVDIVFSHWTIGFMFFFVISTVYALMSVKGILNERDIRFGFGLLSTCFLLLIPYIIFVKEYLKPDHYIADLVNRARYQLHHRQMSENSLPEEITQIDYLIVSSQRLDDYDTYEKGLSALTKLVDDAPDESSKILILNRMETVARSFIAKPHAPEIVLACLDRIGTEAVNHSRYSILAEISRLVTDIGDDAVKSHNSYAVYTIVRIFKTFGNAICTKKDWILITKQLLRNLTTLGDQSMKRKMPASAELVVKLLGELGENVGQNSDFESLTYETVNLLKSLAHTAQLAEYDEVQRIVVLALGNIGKTTTSQPGLQDLTSYIISAWETSSEGLEL